MARRKDNPLPSPCRPRLVEHKSPRNPLRRSSRLLDKQYHEASVRDKVDLAYEEPNWLTPETSKNSDPHACQPQLTKKRRWEGDQEEPPILKRRRTPDKISPDHREERDTRIDWVEDWLEDTIISVPEGVLEAQVIEEPPSRGGFIRMPINDTESQPTSYVLGPCAPLYYKTLQGYNIYVEVFNPPEKLLKEVETVAMAHRSEEMDLLQAARIVELSRKSRTLTEQEVITTLRPVVFAFLSALPNCIIQSSNQPWADAFPLEPSSRVRNPQPVSVPRPDFTFSIAPVDTLSSEQQNAANSLLIEESCVAMPIERGGWFPFLTMEFKSVATKGTRHVGTGQASLAGAVMLRTLHELYDRATGKDLTAESQPLFFSVVMDHEIAAVNFHWLGHSSDGELTMNLEQICICALRKARDVQLLQRVVQNIMQWAEKTYIPWIRKLLDQYGKCSYSERQAEQMPPPSTASFKRRRSTRGRTSSRTASSTRSTNSTTDQDT